MEIQVTRGGLATVLAENVLRGVWALGVYIEKLQPEESVDRSMRVMRQGGPSPGQ